MRLLAATHCTKRWRPGGARRARTGARWWPLTPGPRGTGKDTECGSGGSGRWGNGGHHQRRGGVVPNGRVLGQPATCFLHGSPSSSRRQPTPMKIETNGAGGGRRTRGRTPPDAGGELDRRGPRDKAGGTACGGGQGRRGGRKGADGCNGSWQGLGLGLTAEVNGKGHGGCQVHRRGEVGDNAKDIQSSADHREEEVPQPQSSKLSFKAAAVPEPEGDCGAAAMVRVSRLSQQGRACAS